MKPAVDPRTVKLALKVAGVVLAVATAVVLQWEAGAITDGATFAQALIASIAGNLNGEP
jgi:hypothetical protein